MSRSPCSRPLPHPAPGPAPIPRPPRTPRPAAHLPGWLLCAIGTAAGLGAVEVQAQPSQRPLLVSSTGAKPNIVISLDNSGSMAIPYPDGYDVSRPGWRGLPTGDDGQPMFEAQRSPDVNPMYYNPRITYRPRVDAKGEPLQANDGIQFISNASSAAFSYKVFADPMDPAGAGPVLIISAQFPNYPPVQEPKNQTPLYSLSLSQWAPVNRPHGAADLNSNTPPFTYVLCDKAAPNGALRRTAFGTTCNRVLRTVDVRHDGTDPIALPADHQRTDCAQALKLRCTREEEVTNILNWYRYYRTRIEAITTALGQALHSDKLTDGLARIGYRPINMVPESGAVPQLGKSTNRPQVLRGVRPWATGPANEQFYQWLYGNYANGGTPLQRAYKDVASYFGVGTGAKENPWARDPSRVSDASNPELGCRRAYQVVLSDGGWSDDDLRGTPPDTPNQDATQGPGFTRSTAGNAPAETFAYQPEGISSGRQRYVPYPGPATGGLADLAAQYHWHTDLRPQLENNVPTRDLQPAFWQNLTTYAIGYLIRPSGDNGVASGLSFQQINTYRNQYLANGYQGATSPRWPSKGADLRTTAWNNSYKFWEFARPESDRIDDFIQSGYTGGGRSFSVQDAAGVRATIDAILSDILDASGNDAGIALGSAPAAADSLDGRLKFKVDYRTTDNIGNVTAQQVDQNGNPQLLDQDANGQALKPPSETYWSAQQQMPAPADRRLYSLGDDGLGVELKGRLDRLPSGIRSALRMGAHADKLPDDERFVDYLRGKDPVIDLRDQPYRLRASPLGAIVNSAPVLLGASQHYGYEDAQSTVSGKASYAAYRDRIALPPDTLFVATNAGVVHALDATNGREIAAYMPRRSLRRLLDQAQPDSGFRYVLDGPLSTHDVFDGSSWNSLVVGSGGRGERVIYALRPRLGARGETQMDQNDFLWETGPDAIDTANDGDNTPFATGHMTNPARSGQTDSGDWVVVLNSGHYNGQADGSRHGLVVLNALTGQVLRTITLPVAYSAGRGLGGVTLVRDTRKRIVAAYAGDARGHLWRFDLRGAPANWRVSYGQPLFTAENHRPIYAAPAWQAHPKGGLIVVAATGMLLEDSDASDTSQREAIYGIWDPTSRTDGSEAANFQTVSPDQLLEQKPEALKATVDGKSYFSISRHPIAWDGPQASKGWQLRLGGADGQGQMARAGERVIEPLANAGSSVVIGSVVINRGGSDAESCTGADAPGGAIYVLNALDGAGRRAFDTDQDGRLDEASMVFVAAGGYARGNALVNTTPEAKMGPAQHAERYVATQNGESSFNNPGCRAARLSLLGVGNGQQAAGVSCPAAWSRQQYQLTRLPQ
ncbi:pilus assembly protein [Hydrogenophaga borbori]|uniref:pilus assembly protein n=1 Tax=Hydrogenophaga borbori TaxID=2294117 RepID=UPI00301CFB11